MNFEDNKQHRVKYNNKLKDRDSFFKVFGNLDDETYAGGAIDKKHKELMGLAISVVTRCNECIAYHLEGCINSNATSKEIIEAIKIGVIGGGSITYPNARFAMEVLEELETR
ncbi:MAG: carboxymuconolactone decarboxylase family protein [Coprobacillaceae bacterium]